MSVTDRTSVSVAELRAKTAAVHAARRRLMAKNRRRVQRAVAVRQFNDTVREATEALVPVFVEQGRSIAARIEEVSVPASASELVRLAFDPSEWRGEYADRLLPIFARRMAEAGVVHLLTYGIDVRRRPKGKGLKYDPSQPRDEYGRWTSGGGSGGGEVGQGPGAGAGSGGGQEAPKRYENPNEWFASLSDKEKEAVLSWMGSGFEKMKEADRDGTYNEDLVNLKKAIKTAPLYKGVLHRGIRDTLDYKVGEEVTLKAVSSFSSELAVAKTFAVTDPVSGMLVPRDKEVSILVAHKHNGGSQLPVFGVGGEREFEALMEKGRRFRVSKVEKIKINGRKFEWNAKMFHLDEVTEKWFSSLRRKETAEEGSDIIVNDSGMVEAEEGERLSPSRFADNDDSFLEVVKRNNEAEKRAIGFDARQKATTASEWVEENREDWESLEEVFLSSGEPMGVLTEIPDWMRKSILKRLSESFSQDYWDAVSATTMGDAERVLRRGLAEGWSVARMAQELRHHFEGDGLRYARFRAENIVRTESANALNSARKDSVTKLQRELGDRVPMKQAWHSVLGNTTRATHAMLDGVPEDKDGMWELSGYPVPWPGHYSLPPEERCNCFPAGVLVSGDFTGAQRAWYEGRFAKIVTRKGAVLTLTANHPVVTGKGLVAAGMVQPGDEVLTYKLHVDDPLLFSANLEKSSVWTDRTFAPFGCGNDVNNEPAPVEQVFQALADVAPVEVRRCSARDFYGDAAFFQGDVQIVRTDWILPQHVESVVDKEVADLPLVLAGSSGTLLGELRSGGADELHLGRFHPSSGFPRFSKPLCGRFHAVPGVSPTCSLAVGPAADFDSSLSESSKQDGPAVSGFLRDALERHSGLVEFDEVVEVRDFYSAGHVYDLQSRWGLIVASDSFYTGNGVSQIGIITSNCQCSLTIEFGMREEEAQAEIEEYFARVEEYSAEREEEGEASAEVRLKYDPNQPRDEHGRWTDAGGGGGSGGERPRRSERYKDPDEWFRSLTEKQVNAVNEWIGPSHEEMREADKEGAYDPDLENLKEALKTAPLYKSPIHRGLRYDLGAKRGSVVTLDAISSFSSNPEVAKKFAVVDPSTGDYMPQDSVVSVISLVYHRGGYQLPKVEVEGISEDEVLMEKGRKLLIKRVENTVIEREGMRWKAKIYHAEELGIFSRRSYDAEKNAIAAADVVSDALTRERRRLLSMRFAEYDPSYIRVEEPNDEAEERTIGVEREKAEESPAATRLKYDPNQPRDEHGRWTDAGGGGSGRESRAERAKRTHKPSTKEKQRRGRFEQDRLAKELGGYSTPDNDAFDVLLGKHAIEVKTLMDNKNNKVTVHPSSRRRKLKYEKKHGVKGHLVAIDVRSGRREYYYRDSVGSYKLSAMERVSLSELKKKFGA